MTAGGAREWEWPDSLDALRAAPKNHRLVFENEDARLLDTRIAPGETVPVHTHRWPSLVYVLSSSDFVRCDHEGNVLLDTRAAGIVLETGSALWTDRMAPHTVENVGEVEIRVLGFEVKR